MSRKFLYILLFIFITNCGLTKKDKVINDGSIDIFKEDDPIKEEFNSNLKIKKIDNFKLNPFINNNTNNHGNINYDTNFKKLKKFKFSKIKKFNSNQPELFFTNKYEIIFFNGKGTVIKLDRELNKIWEINNYNKKEKKLNPILYFAQVGNKLIVNDNISKMYAIDLQSGNIIWSKYSSSSFNSDIKVFKDLFIAVDFDNIIRGISSSNGKEIWKFQTENSFIKSEKKL